MAATAASNTNVDIPWRRHPHTTKRRQRIGKIRTMTSTTTKHTYIQLLSNEKIVEQKTEPSQRTSRTGEMVARRTALLFDAFGKLFIYLFRYKSILVHLLDYFVSLLFVCLLLATCRAALGLAASETPIHSYE